MSTRLPHTITSADDGAIGCSTCGRTFRATPLGGCPARQAPSALDQRRPTPPPCRRCLQRPAGASGVCSCCWPAEQSHQRHLREAAAQRGQLAAVAQAQQLLRRRPLIVATTASYQGTQATLLAVAVIASDGGLLLDSLVRPAGPVTGWALARYRLPQAVLRGAPTLATIGGRLDALLDRATLAAWRPWAAQRGVEAALAAAGRYAHTDRWADVQALYAAYRGGARRAPRLPGRGVGPHRTAVATLNALRAVAGLTALPLPPDTQARPVPSQDDLELDSDPDEQID